MEGWKPKACIYNEYKMNGAVKRMCFILANTVAICIKFEDTL